MMHRTIRLLGAVMALFVLMPVSTSIGGGIHGSSAPEQLGVRLLKPSDANARPGATVEAVVVDPAKLASHGLQGAQVNDKVLITVGQNRKYDVKHARTGKARSVNLPEKPAKVGPPSARQDKKAIERLGR